MVYPLDPEGCTPGEEQELKRLYPHFLETGHRIRDVIQSTLLNETSEYFLHDPEECATICKGFESTTVKETSVKEADLHNETMMTQECVAACPQGNTTPSSSITVADAEKEVDVSLAKEMEHVVPLERSAEAASLGFATSARNIDCSQSVRKRHRADADCAAPTVRYRGVRQTRNGRWSAEIGISTQTGYTTKYLGRWDTAEEAAREYDETARRLLGNKARLNFPMEGEAVRYRGVYPYPDGRWQARIYVSTETGRTARNLGVWDTAEKAARAYDLAARSLQGDKARPNFLMEGEAVRYREVKQTHYGRLQAESFVSTESGSRNELLETWDTAEEAFEDEGPSIRCQEHPQHFQITDSLVSPPFVTDYQSIGSD